MTNESTSAALTIETKIKDLEQGLQNWNSKLQEFDNSVKKFIEDPKAEGTHMSVINGALEAYKDMLKSNMTTINGAIIAYKESHRLISAPDVEEVQVEVLEPLD